MFQQLSEKFCGILDRLRGKGILTENDLDQALREVRIALFEADVAVPVVKEFIHSIKEKALGEIVLKRVSPEQMVIKIVHEELIALLGGGKEAFLEAPLKLRSSGVTVVLMVGLQGSGKTAMSAKIGHFLKKKKVLMASLDVYRPAAQLQLEQLGKMAGVETLEIIPGEKPGDITKRGLEKAMGYDVLILDTAGRIHIQDALMEELRVIKEISSPQEIFFVADALLGQEALKTAQAFHDFLGLTGICFSRIDADGRGGAVLSIKSAIQQPIRFLGTGERPHQVDLFDPRRMADRILDRGDVVDFVEKMSSALSAEDQIKTMEQLQKEVFNFNHLAKQLRQLEKMGGVASFLQWLPGMRTLLGGIKDKLKETSFKKQLAIIDSMTPQERIHPEILKASRKKRIALGSGTSVMEVNRLISQLDQMKKVMKHIKKGSFPI